MPTDPHPPTPIFQKIEFKPVFVLLSSLLFVALLFAFGRLDFFYTHIAPRMGGDRDIELYAHLYLAACSVITRTILPLLCILTVLKDRPKNYGYRLKGSGGLGKIYLVLLVFMIPVLFLASSTEAFSQRYPLYSGAGKSLQYLLIYEASYFFVFLSGESLWRGYLVFGLRSTFGYYAIPIMAIPYVMIHHGKPMPEAMGALITACVLGWLALKHRSFWLGIALHFTVALSMDLLALWHKGEFGGT